MSSVDNLSFIPTKSSLLKQKIPENFKIITFESHKPKPKKQKEQQIEDNKLERTNELDLKKTRHEIFKFGMSGFDPERKEEAKVQLAIKLGAKPPKNKYKNYKQLQEERRNEKLTEQKRIEFQQLGKTQQGKSNAKGNFFKRKKNPSQLLKNYGKATLKEITKNKK